MSKPTEKPYNNGQWTASRYRSFIKSALRKASTRWPPKYTVLKEAEVGRKINAASGRMAMHYRCKGCSGEFPAKVISVDHIEPVIPPDEGFTTWDSVIERMFCEAAGLQVLCKNCHDIKTKAERERRKK